MRLIIQKAFTGLILLRSSKNIQYGTIFQNNLYNFDTMIAAK